mgnify:CR=1 FL=1
MELETLQDLYIDELKDLYSAENQLLKALPRMAKAATHKDLKKAFMTHEKQTREHVKRLERICKKLGVSPKGKKCHGMEGLVDEGKELIGEKPEPEVLDAGLISKAQHVEHYEMAGYGTVRTWARPPPPVIASRKFSRRMRAGEEPGSRETCMIPYSDCICGGSPLAAGSAET